MGPYDFKPRSRDGLGIDWPIGYEDMAPYYDKVEEYGESLFVVLRTAALQDGKSAFGETHVFVGPRYVVYMEQQSDTGVWETRLLDAPWLFRSRAELRSSAAPSPAPPCRRSRR